MFTPPAAAPLMPPELVSAEGVAPAPPSPSPPFPDEVLLAWLRSPPIRPVTPPAGASLSPSAGAPAALALPVAVEVEVFDAASVIAPVVLIARSSEASAGGFAMLRGGASPVRAGLPGG